ncbi:MAG: sugar ABC transporter permease [Nitrososphaeria archaeon]|nr:sugar ABC transporter permease [Nitrososphaeria archaeon]
MKFEKRLPLIMLLPAIVLTFGLTIFPLFSAIYYSTTDLDLSNPFSGGFVGSLNYYKLLNADIDFSLSSLRSILFTIACIAIQIPLGIGLGLLLHQPLKGQKIYRAILTLPLVAAPIAIGQIWRIMYHYEFGIIKYSTELIFGWSPNWTADPNVSLLSIVIYDTWQWTPFVALIILAGLQSLPQEPFESAKVYGASSLQTFRYITLPMLRPYIGLALIFRIIDTLRTWDPIWAITQGGPGQATETLSFYLYRIGLKQFFIGYANAASLIFLYAIIVLCAITLRRFRL